MREHYGWQFPDFETHLPRMLKKSLDKGLPAEYQIAVRQRSIELCTRRDVALDIGANVGLWSRDLVKSFGRVIAFEPVAVFRECLETNVKGDNFEVRPIALGDQDTTGTMIITEDNSGHSHLDPNTIGAGDIQVVRLDSLNLQNINYIKINFKGYEYRILKGVEQLILSWRSVVVL
jgi:FkbM family methyltransferase